MTGALGAESTTIETYYEILQSGADRFDAEQLRAILAPQLVFEGPIAGHRVGAEPFCKGVVGVTVQPLGETVHHLRQQGAYRREFRPTSPPPSPQGNRPTSNWQRRTTCSGPDSLSSSSGWTSWKLRTSP